MVNNRYKKLDIAARQLETAVSMFFKGQDRFSVITLAGAASGILTQLVINAGKQPFVDYARLYHNELFASTPSRQKYNRHINDRFGINALKHHAAADTSTVEVAEDDAAESAITRAMVDYIELRGQREPFVVSFLNWMWVSRDGRKMMDQYETLPKKIKRLKK
jgi:hypothetical protein